MIAGHSVSYYSRVKSRCVYTHCVQESDAVMLIHELNMPNLLRLASILSPCYLLYAYCSCSSVSGHSTQLVVSCSGVKCDVLLALFRSDALADASSSLLFCFPLSSP